MPFSSSQPSLRLRMLPRFPAQVLAGTGMLIEKSGGVYTFSVALTALPLTSLQDIETDKLVGRDTAGDGKPEQIGLTNGLEFSGDGSIRMTTNQRLRAMSITLTGSPISTGIKGDIVVPYAGTIQRVSLLADQSGDIVVDIWKDTYANYPPVVGDSITASAKPTLSSATKYEDATLTGWTTAVAAGDILRFNVDSAATVTRVQVTLDISVT